MAFNLVLNFEKEKDTQSCVQAMAIAWHNYRCRIDMFLAWWVSILKYTDKFIFHEVKLKQLFFGMLLRRRKKYSMDGKKCTSTLLKLLPNGYILEHKYCKLYILEFHRAERFSSIFLYFCQWQIPNVFREIRTDHTKNIAMLFTKAYRNCNNET